MNIYPWHHAVWNKLASARERFPHALLLQGKRGIGKLDFAVSLAQTLLCEQVGAEFTACDACESCTWFSQGNHPDFRMLEPVQDSGEADEAKPASSGGKKTQITVDQVRELQDFLALSSHRSGVRIVLLHPAEALNPAASNALLKMLEEPPAGVLFLLVTHHPQRLLATIRSRCTKLDMPIPPRSQAESWLREQGVDRAGDRLAYVGGSPLQAAAGVDEGDQKRLGELHRRLAQAGAMDPFAVSTNFAREGVGQIIDAMQRWIYDLTSLRLSGEVRYHLSQAESLQALSKQVDLPKLLNFQGLLTEARRLSQHPLNAELQIESLMIQYTQLFTKGMKP